MPRTRTWKDAVKLTIWCVLGVVLYAAVLDTLGRIFITVQ
jgi:hypothetical protein